eukprot:4001940-Pleurochrysis_carterae.AAC.1
MVKDNAAMRSELRKLQAKERWHFASMAENARDHVKLRDEAAAGRCAVNRLHGERTARHTAETLAASLGAAKSARE